MAEKEKYKDNRARTWTSIVYPESAPENWKDTCAGKLFVNLLKTYLVQLVYCQIGRASCRERV